MFQPQPAAQQRRHRRLPSGTMVSYAEVKSYLSKREIPQLFESLMAGLMYHRPENHIGYLQTCLDEVKSNSESKVHWSTFVNRKRKSKEILPPLTPKKQDSFSSWSDNSRQSTPLPPISARARTRTSPEQQDLRNTYILYHNPPPILAKPKVPVVSVLGGLGGRIDELCERVVGRLRGVVHISTCSMLKTRMTIEGFYRVTSVPACAVVDSVLQAMSMVQSANALIVAGFPRNRGDIEEYRSRRVRMDGVVLVDFEEDALRRFLNKEVSTGAVRVSEVETELERYKQDIISVAEYYDEKELLTVVMGDQDTDEMIEDMIMAVDKIIETRKHIHDDDSVSDGRHHECSDDGTCKALIPTPNGVKRPSTVEIRDATEEDIKAIETESKRPSEGDKDDIETLVNGVSVEQSSEQFTKSNTEGAPEEPSKPDVAGVILTQTSEVHTKSGSESEHSLDEVTAPPIPLLFAFENINTDNDNLKDLIVNEMGMCYINFQELVRDDDDKDGRLGIDESLNLLQSVLQRDAVSYSNGFFISNFAFDMLSENKFDKIQRLGEVTFICKVKENSSQSESEGKEQREKVLFDSPMSEQVRIIFVTENNIVEELKYSLQETASKNDTCGENSIEKPSDAENNMQDADEAVRDSDLEKSGDSIDKEVKIPPGNKGECDTEGLDKVSPVSADSPADGKNNGFSDADSVQKDNNLAENNLELEAENQESCKERTSRDENEDSTCQDVEDLITDDTLNDGTKRSDSLQHEEEIKESSHKEVEVEDTLSQVSEEGLAHVEGQKEKAVLERQQNLDLETTTSASESSTQLVKDAQEDKVEDEVDSDDKPKLVRQGTYLSASDTPRVSDVSRPDIEKQEPDLETDIEDSSMKESDGASQTLSEINQLEEHSEGMEETVKKKVAGEENESVPADNGQPEELADDHQSEKGETIKSEDQVSDTQELPKNVEETETTADPQDAENSDKDNSAKSETEEKTAETSEKSDVVERSEEIQVSEGAGDVEGKTDSIKSETEENDDRKSKTVDETSHVESERSEVDESGASNNEIGKQSDKGEDVNTDNGEDVKTDNGEDVKTDNGENVKSENGEDVKTDDGEDVKADDAEDVKADDAEDVKADDTEDVKADNAEDVKADNAEDVKADDAEDVKTENGEDVKTDDGEDVKTENEEDVKSNNGEDVKIDNGEDVKTDNGEDVKTDDSEDVKIDSQINGETVEKSEEDSETDAKAKQNESPSVDEDQKSENKESDSEEKCSDEANASLEENKNGGSNTEANTDNNSSTEDSEGNSQIELSKLTKADDNEEKPEADDSANDLNSGEEDGVDNTNTPTGSDKDTNEIENNTTQILKAIDNDSDSNDENAERSITIETQAEVHAPDSESPPLIQDGEDGATEDKPEAEETTTSDGNEESKEDGVTDTEKEGNLSAAESIHQEVTEDGENGTTRDKPEAEEAETAAAEGNEEGKNEDLTDGEKGDNSLSAETNNNLEVTEPKEETINESQTAESKETDDTETEPQTTEPNETDLTIEEPSLTELKELDENTEESQITTVKEMEGLASDRYSAKHQERNGSGILGESRHEDQPEGEEAQERSSSSSRGEL